MKRNKELENLYNYDVDTNTYEMSIALRDYDEAFNEYDYAQFRKRDLDADFFDYLLTSSKDIPYKSNLRLAFYIKKEKVIEEKSEGFIKAIRNNCRWSERINTRNMKSAINHALLYLIIGSIIFIASIFLMGKLDSLKWLRYLVDTATIVAWVFIWKSVELIAFEIPRLRRENRYLRRLENSQKEVRTY